MKTTKKITQSIGLAKIHPSIKSMSSRILDIWSDKREEKIRERAFIIYLNRGENSGNEHDDWHMAEKEIELSEE